MRFVARLASSPRVTTLELPRPSTRDDPPPRVDPPLTAAALDLSDALDDDDDTDRDGLGFFARAPASSRRRVVAAAEASTRAPRRALDREDARRRGARARGREAAGPAAEGTAARSMAMCRRLRRRARTIFGTAR